MVVTMMKEADRLRAEFLGMASHELRMPLTSIRGAVTALQDAAADLETEQLFAQAREYRHLDGRLARKVGRRDHPYVGSFCVSGPPVTARPTRPDPPGRPRRRSRPVRRSPRWPAG